MNKPPLSGADKPPTIARPEIDAADDTGLSFIERWSRRKRQPETAPNDHTGTQLETTGEALEAEPDLPLPSLDDLTVDGDVTAFLQKRVPEELRRLALRRMWSLDPQIRDFIEMAENQYDWNTPGGVPGYGDLNPGFDLEALLAQATGKGPAAPDADITTAATPSPANAGHDALADAADAGPTRDSSPDTEKPVELTAATEETGPPESSQNCEHGDEFVGSAKQPTEQRTEKNGYRRHGSALPV